jgi:hypothetical protein
MAGIDKRIVYTIRSDVDSSRHYVGMTGNVGDQLDVDGIRAMVG